MRNNPIIVTAESSCFSGQIFSWNRIEAATVKSCISTYLDQNVAVTKKIRIAKEVWIKPNITGIDASTSGRTTNPAVLESFISLVVELRGKRDGIFVSDSSVIGVDTLDAAAAVGILEVCKSLQIPFVDLKKKPFVYVKVDKSILYSQMAISAPYTDSANFTINLAKLKTTFGTPAGFCIKNSKGIIPDDMKLTFHLRGINKSLCDLFHSVNWGLCILEGMPISELGVSRQNSTGSLFLCENPLAIDLFACSEYSLPIDDIPYLNELQKTHSMIFSPMDSRRPKDNLSSLVYSKTGIKELEQEYPVTILDGKSCTSCLESLAKAIRKTVSKSTDTILLLVGASHELSEDLCHLDMYRAVAVGNCSFDFFGMQLVKSNYNDSIITKWNEILKIPGCPPTIDQLKDALILLSRSKINVN